MQLMFELTRRCNMQCSHCLRGEAEGVDMSREVISEAMRKFDGEVDSYSFGGGETMLKPKLIHEFIDMLGWVDTKWFEAMWIVTNAKRLIDNQECQALPYNYTSYDDEDEDISYKNNEFVDAIMRLSNYFPIDLAVSTDQFHGEEAKQRFKDVQYIFENQNNINVVQHGPRQYHNLIGMGRYLGGKARELFSSDEENVYYITVKGDIYPCCDMSYKFMDSRVGEFLWLGNVLTMEIEDIMERVERFNLIVAESGDMIEIDEDTVYCDFDEEEIETMWQEFKQNKANEELIERTQYKLELHEAT